MWIKHTAQGICIQTAVAVLLVGALQGCGVRAEPRRTEPAEAIRSDIVRTLEASAERWNAGDLKGFLEPYLDSPELTFVGSTGLVRGKEALEVLYRDRYFREGAPRQTLRFGAIEVRPLGPGHALAVGRYLLFDSAGAQVAEGPFSLVLTRTSEGWRIVHDHSS